MGSRPLLAAHACLRALSFLSALAVGGCKSAPVTPVLPASSAAPSESAATADATLRSSESVPQGLSASPESSAAPSASKPAADATFLSSEYIARGLPSIERSWTGADYKAAADLLSKLAEESPGLLPRSASPRSGAVFHHLASKDNLLLLANKKVLLALRVSASGTIQPEVVRLFMIYLRALSAGHPVDREVLELMLLLCHVSRAAWDIADELLPTLDKKDPTYPTRLQGMERMKHGTADMVSGTIESLTEHDAYATPNLTWFAAELASVLPGVVRRITPMNQSEAKQRLARIAASEPDPAYRKQLDALSAAVSVGP